MWNYIQPVEIVFGTGSLMKLADLLKREGYQNGLLVISTTFYKAGYGKKLLDNCHGRLKDCFYGIEPNPSIQNVDDCVKKMREVQAEFVVAMGGGSVLDCAKAAAAVFYGSESAAYYHGAGNPLPEKALPIIAIPTTAGTGSEVTSVAVLTDKEKGKKAPMGGNTLFPKIAIVDAELTYPAPPHLTAYSGLDALSHCLEGFWSKNHQPICDALALHGAELIFENLEGAVANGKNAVARENLAEASVIAGLTFCLPKTTASHACSFPLTNLYHIPHGEACALTLDYFVKYNADAENGRLHHFAKKLGFENAYKMAERIAALKIKLGVRRNLKDFHLTSEQFKELVEKSKHPLLQNNPIEVTDGVLRDLYTKLM